MLQNELPWLEMIVLNDSPGLVRSAWAIIKENKSLVEEVEALKKTVRNEKAAWKVVKEHSMTLESSVTASIELATRLRESEKALEAACAAVELFKEQGTRADAEKVDSKNPFLTFA